MGDGICWSCVGLFCSSLVNVHSGLKQSRGIRGFCFFALPFGARNRIQGQCKSGEEYNAQSFIF